MPKNVSCQSCRRVTRSGVRVKQSSTSAPSDAKGKAEDDNALGVHSGAEQLSGENRHDAVGHGGGEDTENSFACHEVPFPVAGAARRRSEKAVIGLLADHIFDKFDHGDGVENRKIDCALNIGGVGRHICALQQDSADVGVIPYHVFGDAHQFSLDTLHIVVAGLVDEG